MFVDLDTTFTALAEVARPFIQETISEGAADAEQATLDTLPRIRPVPRQHAPACSTTSSPARRRAAPDRADDRRRARGRRAGARATRRPLNRAAGADRRGAAAASTTTPASAPGSRACTQTTDIFGPALRFIAPAQTVCNYATLLVRNLSGVVHAAATTSARWQRFTVFDVPKGPNNEGSPSSATGQRRRHRQQATSSTPTRTRTPPRRARRASARPATSPTRPARSGDRQRARQPGHGHRRTSPVGPRPRGRGE